LVILRPWTEKIVLFIEQIKWCTENYYWLQLIYIKS